MQRNRRLELIHLDRLCSGRILADSSIFLAMASLLSILPPSPVEGCDKEQLLDPTSFALAIVR